MTWLPLANLWHRKLRSALSMLAVGIGAAMLVVMLGLSHGTLDEVADRLQSVDAELVVLPQHENVIFMGGAAFNEKYRTLIEQTDVDGRPCVRAVIPVLFDTIRLGGQQQRLFAIDREDMQAFLGGRRMLEGRLFDEQGRFAKRLDALRNAEGYYDPTRVPEDALDEACELVIDARLAAVGGYRPGHTETIFGRPFRIVGIIESGVAGRVFCSIQMLQLIKSAGLPWASMFFVQLAPPPPGAERGYAERAAAAIAERTRARVELKTAYGDLLAESFSQIYMFINSVSAVTMVVCFLFILLTMYATVLERTREIGILRSLGAGRAFLLRQAAEEALLICVPGTLLGIMLAYVAKFVIEIVRPLLTVKISPAFLVLALGVGVLGGVCSALYPGYRAAKLDPAAALNFD
jgi:putative ABC transport system permease protein